MTKESRIYDSKRIISSMNGIGKFASHMQKNKAYPHKLYTKINANGIKDLNIRPETINL